MEEGRRATARLAACCIAVACGSSDPPQAAPRVGKVFRAMLEAATQTTAPWRCAALDTPALPAEDLTIGTRTWHVKEHTLARRDPDAEVVIGVVADAAGAAPRTIAAIGRLRAKLDAAAPDLIISLGGMGATEDELEATLGTLSDRATWPVVALPGDLERMTAHAAAIATLRKRGDAVFDGRLVRWIEVPGATIGTLPGAGAVERLVGGGDGCAWQADDVAKLYAELTAKPGLRVVVSAEAPRQTVAGEPRGELGLAPSSVQPIELTVHGPVRPAPSPARSGRRDGAHVALSPGTADATPRLPDRHTPSAGVLVLRAGAWSWRPLVDTK